jgi:hypothetical protein
MQRRRRADHRAHSSVEKGRAEGCRAESIRLVEKARLLEESFSRQSEVPHARALSMLRRSSADFSTPNGF